MATNMTDTREIFSVSEINQQIKHAIAANFALLWIEGEISNLARPASGHLYFSIKDKNAQLRCVMFRNSNSRVPFEITNGLQVIIRAKASVYEARGDLQLIVDGMEEAGFGALQRQFEALKNKLFQEGLFDEAAKKEIPPFPSEIAIITSPTGAAVKDYLKIAQRRYPHCKKTIYSVPVQGDQAAAAICSAIHAANIHAKADVIVLIRGGGSIEDLWSFNDESLARAIADSSIPVVSGIGHEIDYTIADFVADLRAPTPSAAAELTCPDTEVLQAMLANTQETLRKLSIELINTCSQSIDWLSRRLQRTHPSTIITIQQLSLQRLADRLQRSTLVYAKDSQHRLQNLYHRLHNQSPQKLLTSQQTLASTLQSRLREAIHHQLNQLNHKLQLCATTMNAVSPLNTLQRGYSITTKNNQSSDVVSHYSQVKKGDQLTTHLASGEVISRVESTGSKNIIDKFSTSNKDQN